MKKGREIPSAKGYCDCCDATYGNPYTKCHICGNVRPVPRSWKKRKWEKEVELELLEMENKTEDK